MDKPSGICMRCSRGYWVEPYPDWADVEKALASRLMLCFSCACGMAREIKDMLEKEDEDVANDPQRPCFTCVHCQHVSDSIEGTRCGWQKLPKAILAKLETITPSSPPPYTDCKCWEEKKE